MAAREENPREYVKSSSTSRTYPDFVVNWVCSTSRLCVSHRLLSQEPPAPKIHGALPCARPGVTEINWKRPFQARYNCGSVLSSPALLQASNDTWNIFCICVKSYGPISIFMEETQTVVNSWKSWSALLVSQSGRQRQPKFVSPG